jgi:hypothetical protein
MTLFLPLFSVFNLMLAAACAGMTARLLTRDGASGWASKRLLWFSRFACALLCVGAIAATAGAWRVAVTEGFHWAGPLILTPLTLVILLGIVFAIIDVSEDGVLDFGRGAREK